MGRACYLCDRQASRNDNISLHAFPKEPSLRERWKQACGLNERDNVSRVCICSAHFSADNLLKIDGLVQSRIRLRMSAVPTKSVPVKIVTPYVPSHKMQNNINDRSVKVATESNVTQSARNCGPRLMELAVNNVENISPATRSAHIYILPHCQSLVTEVAANVSIDSDCAESHTPPQRQFGDHDYILKSASHPTSSEHTPQKRRFFDPRFISEISTSDFSTPKRARLVLKLVKETDAKKSKTIKTLHNKLSYLKKRILALQDLVLDFADEGHISKEAGNHLLKKIGYQRTEDKKG